MGTACEPTERYNPQSNSKEERTLENCSEAVAKIMEIQWTSEQGATEKLTEFNRRVKECMGEEVIQEDDPRWDCKTMGNKKCGKS